MAASFLPFDLEEAFKERNIWSGLKHSVLRADKIDESRRVFKTKVQWHHISNITTYECPLGIDQRTK